MQYKIAQLAISFTSPWSRLEECLPMINKSWENSYLPPTFSQLIQRFSITLPSYKKLWGVDAAVFSNFLSKRQQIYLGNSFQKKLCKKFSFRSLISTTLAKIFFSKSCLCLKLLIAKFLQNFCHSIYSRRI